MKPARSKGLPIFSPHCLVDRNIKCVVFNQSRPSWMYMSLGQGASEEQDGLDGSEIC